MVKTFQDYLPEECPRTYSCMYCRAHLAKQEELISKVSVSASVNVGVSVSLSVSNSIDGDVSISVMMVLVYF